MQYFKNFKVRNKIISIIVISSFITIFISSLSLNQNAKMSENIESVYEQKFILNDWLSNAIAVNLQISSIIIEMMMTTDIDEKKALHNEINEGVDQVLVDLTAYAEMDLSDEERAGLASFYEAVDQLTFNQDEVIRLALEGKNEEAYAMYTAILRLPRLKPQA